MTLPIAHPARSELDVKALRLFSQGFTRRETAARLRTSESNLANRMFRFYQEIGAKNVAHAVRIGIEEGFI